MSNKSEPLEKGSYMVFAVESADRFQLLSAASTAGQPPSIYSVLVSGIKAPKPGRAGTSDEPCAHMALEFARDLLIGKTVRFHPEEYVDALQRTSGRVEVGQGGETDVALTLLREGLAALNERGVAADRLTQLTAALNEAKKIKKGIHAATASKSIRPVLAFPPPDIAALAMELKGKTLKVRVERVQSACTMFVSLPSHQQVLLHLTGVTTITDQKEAVVSIVAEGKFFTERMLLHRNINVLFDGMDCFLNILGTVKGPKRCFQAELASRGFVRVLPSTIGQTESRAEIEEAEAGAKATHQGLWKVLGTGDAATAGGAAGDTGDKCSSPITKSPAGIWTGPEDFEGEVVLIHSGDQISVIPSFAPLQQLRVNLSGVKCHRGVREKKGNTEARITYDEYSWEAREILRKQFIGKTVRLHVDRSFKIGDEPSSEVRLSVTAIDPETGKNLGAVVLEAGYGRFFLARNDACAGVDALQEAEQKAKKQKRGVHGGDAAPQTAIHEFNRLGDAQGKNILEFLKRGGQGGRPPKLKAVVELVLSAASFRVFVPREHFLISLKLAGVAAPSAIPGQAEDPFYAETRQVAVRLLQQRDVEIQVESSDKGGNFIGAMFLNNMNIAVKMVESGCAAVFNADRVPFVNELNSAQEKAKANKVFIWSQENALPERCKAASAAAEAAEARKATLKLVSKEESGTWKGVSIVHVHDAITLSLQFAKDTATLEEIKTKCDALVASAAHQQPASRELLVAQYPEDESWNRARVVSFGKGEFPVQVQFVDFDCQGWVRRQQLRAIPSGASGALLRDTPPLATRVKLAFCRYPNTGESPFDDAAVDLSWEYAQKPVYGRLLYRRGESPAYLLAHDVNDPKSTLSAVLVRAGCVMADMDAVEAVKEACGEAVAAAQQEARNSHRRLWEFGDVPELEDP